MLQIDSVLLSDFYGKDFIACGTGKTGKIVIPYLAQDPNIRLHGVTNSRILADDAGTFLDTRLPLRSIRTWAKLWPDATILITAGDSKVIEEIHTACQEAGYKKFMLLPRGIEHTIANPVLNLYAVQQLNTIAENSTGSALTENPILDVVGLANEIRDTHTASFSEFKACHKGETVVTVACGPSMNYYAQIQGIPHIGVNSSFLRKDLSLNYYFLFHYIPEWCNQLKYYNFIKFFGQNSCDDSNDKIPEYIFEENQARRFFSRAHGTLHPNLMYYPLTDFFSIIFNALHFALYTRPKRILLVGCDCSTDGYYDGAAQGKFEGDTAIPQWIGGYEKVKRFAALHYPDTEIISVNPVGLRGMFRDVYTESYLDAHPEIDRSEAEILNSADYEE